MNMTLLQGPEHLPQNTEITSLVVLLHGFGADGNDLIGLAPFFASHHVKCHHLENNGLVLHAMTTIF